MTVGTHNTPGDLTLGNAAPDAAVVCVACGYDVRGLSARGRCPECGLGVAVSLAARVAPAASLDPAWRRQITEAAVLSLGAFALLFASTLIPAGSAAFVRRTPPFSRRLFITLVALSAAGWALQWYSTFKLCRTSRFERRTFGSVALAWATQGLAALYSIMPLMAQDPLYARLRSYLGSFETPAALVGPLSAAAYYVWLRRVFRRFGARGPAAQAAMLGMLMPLALLSFRMSLGAGWGPLGLYASLPSYQHGLPSMLLVFAGALFNREASFSTLGFALPSLVAACGTYLHVRLLLLAMRGRGASPAVETGSTAIPSAAGEASC